MDPKGSWEETRLPFLFFPEPTVMIEPVKKTSERRPGQFSLDTPVLTTERLVLRPPVRDDIDDLAIIANAREIAEMTSRMPHPYSREDAAAYIDRYEKGEHEGHVYAITLGETGRLIGMCSVERRDRFGGLEIGYWVGRAWWGQGYASEAAGALVDLAFRVTGTDVIFAACRTVNTRSRQVLVKHGFEFVGLDTIDTLSAGRVPVERFRLDRSSWLTGKQKGA